MVVHSGVRARQISEVKTVRVTQKFCLKKKKISEERHLPPSLKT